MYASFITSEGGFFPHVSFANYIQVSCELGNRVL